MLTLPGAFPGRRSRGPHVPDSARRPRPRPDGSSRINVGEQERVVSAFGGGLLTYLGLTRGSLGGLLVAAAGGVLIYRGATGHCPAFEQLGLDTRRSAARAPIVLREVLTVSANPQEAYGYWSALEELPRFMHHLQSVEVLGEGRSRWTARVPGDHGTVSWEAETTADEPGRLLAWRSVPGADVANAGRVQFAEAPAGRGTEVRVEIAYRPPAGDVGRLAAGFFNPVLGQLVKNDVRRFKQLVETGEVPTIDGQPSGA